MLARAFEIVPLLSGHLLSWVASKSDLILFRKFTRGESMRTNFPGIAVLLFSVLSTMACSEHPKPAQASEASAEASPEASAPSVAVPAKTAFWAVYKSAYAWSSDAVPLKLESKVLPGLKNDEGRAAMWVATFGSVRRRQAIEMSYAVAAQPPDIVKGVNVGHPVSWTGPTRDVMPFQGSDIVTDSDSAYKMAVGKAQPWLKSHPDKQVSFLLGYNATAFATPVWYVAWGDRKLGYRVFVNARNGEVAKPMK